MLRPLLIAAALSAALPGCARLAESPLNPGNWFRGSQEVRALSPDELRPLVPEGALAPIPETRPLVGRITDMSVERTPQGAIVRATGLVATQGHYNAQLVPAGVSGDTLVLEFRAAPPPGFEATGTPETRTITAAHDLDLTELAGIRTIRVVGADNARESRR
ncbi:MAG: hypothetical protein HLUCCA08_08695 [Rhodobacteraceae bacterium HLUCCA08]|nr:MAG: hypothetical protein HLUCCA08_08695 [Rhodobacteraceae bacterium HLUCCA08]